MSIWTSRTAATLCVSAITLGGCDGGPGGGLGPLRKPPQTISVAGGSVIIGGPPGYCIDRGASRVGGDTAFALLASCASIAQDLRAGAPPQLGILTASVAGPSGDEPAIGAPLDALARFVETPAGRATLARDGQAASVEILRSLSEQNAVLIQLRDSSPNSTGGLVDTYWRGFFNLNDRLITISVVEFADQPMSADESLSVLRAFLARIRRETSVQATNSARISAPAARKGLFSGLFQ